MFFRNLQNLFALRSFGFCCCLRINFDWLVFSFR